MSFFDQILSCENLDMSNFLKKIYFKLIRLAARKDGHKFKFVYLQWM